MDEDLYGKLLNASFRFVSFRPRSISEIRDFLVKKLQKYKISDQLTLDKVMERLVELGYADDRKFVSFWVGARQRGNVKGMRMIKYELMRKGVTRDIIEEVISDIQSQKTEPDDISTINSDLDVARTAIAKKLRIWSRLPEMELKKKIYNWLLQRGFDHEVISSLIDEIKQKDYNS
jgi:regulatory protein